MKNLGSVFILGDSYSTFENCIPKGYETWYSSDAQEKTDVLNVKDTWWDMLLRSTNASLLLNDSYSGTTVCNTTYGGEYCPTTSFVGRFDKIMAESVFKEKEPDTIFVFGGTNDNWADCTMSKLQFENWNSEDLKCVLPAFCYLLSRIKTCLKSARLIVIINTELRPDVVNGYIAACKHYNTEYIQLKDIEKQNGHPNKIGMRQIFNQVYNAL